MFVGSERRGEERGGEGWVEGMDGWMDGLIE